MASGLLWVVTGALILVGIGGAVAVFTERSGRSGGFGFVFVFLVALLTGSGARAVAKGGRASHRAFGPRGSTSGSRDPSPLIVLPAIDPQICYRERCSQFPVVGAGICVAVLVVSVIGLVAVGGGHDAGPVEVPLLLGFLICALYIVLIGIDSANGIDIRDGRFVIGARGVPAAGRMWRRISGPLDAVRSWEVLSREKLRLAQSTNGTSSAGRGEPTSLGDLRMFSRRGGFLRLVVNPGSVEARFPARVQQGYVFVNVSQTGLAWDGTVLIGTRRPAALRAALQQALPGRESGNTGP